MDWLTRVKALYEAYLAQTLRLDKNRKFGDGILGFGNPPSKDRCHGEFAEDLDRLVKEMAAAGPADAEREAVLDYIYRAPVELKGGTSADWMLLAVHNLSKPLLEDLSPDAAAAMGAWYGETYQKKTRLPCQKDVMKLLEKRQK